MGFRLSRRTRRRVQLADKDLRALLPQMDITVPSYATKFDERQIQPASIDLRVDRVHWRAQRLPFPIDLSTRFRGSILSRRPTYRSDLGPRGRFELRPGAVVMGRTLEEFTIPSEYAAEIFTRSSFARLGLIVTFGGFINPGYRGHMPLQIKNLGPHTIWLPAMIPVCQLVLRQLTQLPEREYGHAALHSKYHDDDGGPSRWWEDSLIQSSQAALGAANVPDEEQEKLIEIILRRDLSTQLRFEKFVRRASQTDISSVDTALDGFARSERSARIKYRLLSSSIALAVLLVGASIGAVFGMPMGETTYGKYHFILWGVTLLVVIIAAFAGWQRLTARETDFMLPEDIAEMRSRDQN